MHDSDGGTTRTDGTIDVAGDSTIKGGTLLTARRWL